jgi:hypothetical protein
LATRCVDLVARHLAHQQAEADVARHRHVREQRVVLEHHAEAAPLGRQLVDAALVQPDLPSDNGSRPAMQLSAVDLPQPEGPSRAMNSPRRMSRQASAR